MAVIATSVKSNILCVFTNYNGALRADDNSELRISSSLAGLNSVRLYLHSC